MVWLEAVGGQRQFLQGDEIWVEYKGKIELVMPWLVWLSGLGVILQAKGSPVQFPVRARAWAVGQAPQ